MNHYTVFLHTNTNATKSPFGIALAITCPYSKSKIKTWHALFKAGTNNLEQQQTVILLEQ